MFQTARVPERGEDEEGLEGREGWRGEGEVMREGVTVGDNDV